MSLNPKAVRDYIHNLRDYKTVRSIQHAATVRSAELLSRNRHQKKAEVFDKFSWIKKGDTIYIGNKTAALESPSFSGMWARPITVVHVYQRRKEWAIKCGDSSPSTLTPAMAQMLKVSHESNAEAMADALLKRDAPFAIGAQYRLRPRKNGDTYGCDHSIGKVVEVLKVPRPYYREVTRVQGGGCLIVPTEMLGPL